MSWRPGARGGAKRYVCDYLISWFMLIVWFHQSLKWCKLVCSLQILSVSRGVIRIQWSLDSDDTTTWNWLWLEGGQLVRILTSQPGNWNGWIFCTNGDGATVVLYTFIHTSIYHHVSVLCPIMTCCHCSLGLEDNCHVLLKLTWGPIHGRMGTPVANNFLLLLLLFHPNRNV